MTMKVRDAGKVRIVDVAGDVTIGKGDVALRETVQGLLADNHIWLLLNLKKVGYIDSAGLGELVACKKRSAERNGDTKLLLPSKRVRDLLVLVKLTDVFDIFEDELQAVGSF